MSSWQQGCGYFVPIVVLYFRLRGIFISSHYTPQAADSLNKMSEACLVLIFFLWLAPRLEFCSFKCTKSRLNAWNIMYKKTGGFTGKQNRVMTWHSKQKTNRLCRWWQFVILTMVIKSPTTILTVLTYNIRLYISWCNINRMFNLMQQVSNFLTGCICAH